MSTRTAQLLFVLVLLINCVLWSQSRHATVADSASLVGVSLVERRGLDANYATCAPIKLPAPEQCSHVQELCPYSDTVLAIPYTQLYFCTSPTTRPAAFTGLIIWLIFIFSTLGIAASDFFCPNLGTLANVLGLDENVAGVTFLAFGNGSPDVFSTFAAMKSHTASLALGELLGAATFISSVVVGSICLVKPFKVDAYPFLRDIGFFATAVALLQAVLWDGKLHLWETLMLVGLYVLYVMIVVVGSWWSRRKEHHRNLAATVRGDLAEVGVAPEPYTDDPLDDPPRRHSLSPDAARTLSPNLRLQHPSHLSIPSRSISGISTPVRSPSESPTLPAHSAMMASFSLVGALEFREFVTSMTPHVAGAQLAGFEATPSPFAGGYYRRLSRGRTPLSRGNTTGERDPWDYALGGSLQLDHRAYSPAPDRLTQSLVVSPPEWPSSHTPTQHLSVDHMDGADSLSDFTLSVPQLPPRTKGQKIRHALHRAWEILFPTLRNFRAKSVPTKLASLFAVPAVLGLTLTLPVVVTSHHVPAHEPPISGHVATPLIQVEDEDDGIERAVMAEEEVQEEMHDHFRFNKWLTAAQCILGPLFVFEVIFDDMLHQLMLMLSAGIAGLAMAVLVVFFADNGLNPAGRMVRCVMGFFVAVIWIMAIADEVVNVLQTFGFIFGLSNAIIGLTIFAMGNSLADLVANISVAAFAPVMGFSACFGGPMLNMLLGVGVSGSYMILNTGTPYLLEFSTTLVISSIGLLVILLVSAIVVAMNGFHLTRRWGICLICFYVVILAVNVVVELFTHK